MYYNNNNGNYGACNDNQGWKSANIVEEKDIEGGFNQHKMDPEMSMRLGFIRKVYGILSMQLILTTFMCFLSITSQSYAKFQNTHPALLWVALIGSIIVILAICCIPGMSRTVPTNYILLLLFTIFEGYIVSAACSMTNPRIVLMAAAMTCAITIALTVYAWTTKSDFTVCGSMLFLASCCLLILGIFAMFFKFMHVVVATMGIFLYSIYIIYDTQLLIGNKENALDIEDYIFGALMLYLDVINMFLYILQFLKYFNDN